MTHSYKLTDTQLLVLSAASQREDGLLDLAARLKGSALQVSAQKLLQAGLAAEIVVSAHEPHWRTDDAGNRICLKITGAGLIAIGLEPEGAPGDAADSLPPDSFALAQQKREQAPRAGSKKALVLSLLQREEGASLDDLIAATGWLPHTTRAALTGLRQGGHVLDKTKGSDGKAIYRVKPQAEEEATSQALPEAA